MGAKYKEENLSECELKTPWYKKITVEPPMFLYMMAFMITTVIEQTFYVHQACRVNHGYTSEQCYNITQNPDINTEVQATVTKFHQWNGITTHGLPLLLALFIGSYSDKRGRKLVLCAGLVGKLYFSIMITLNTMKDWPVEYVIYTAALPSTLTGADLAIFAACYAYIADVSSIESRTFRISVLNIVYSATMPSGVAIGNYLYYKVVDKSFTIMFAINATLMVMATAYSFVFLKAQTSSHQKSMKQAGVKNPITDFFDLQNIKQTIVTLTKKRPKSRRLFLWLLLVSMALYTFQRDERPVMYLYTTIVFQWDTYHFSNFRTYHTTAYLIAMVVGIPVMTKLLNFRDTVIVLLGTTAQMTGHLIYAHATEGYMLYVGATAAALGPCVAPLIRAMTSKVLAPSERGVAYAFLSVMENLVGTFASILYSQLYNATLNTDYLNSIFYLTFTTQAVIFVFAVILHLMLKGQRLESTLMQDEIISEETSEQCEIKQP